ncbi:hypothetical protein PRK78_003667 [Emydomyces testavorans]|uniref:Protein kinase domain-containing protein n=1 Tax=Emydomyces testavorans TaxID=2070801 RepID=A0AAF0IKT8_9EURO|nr:hypothetical protein PRK78_003667 [Emydomyces testavorans]
MSNRDLKQTTNRLSFVLLWQLWMVTLPLQRKDERKRQEMELDDVRPAEVVFKEKLFASEFSEIFLTVVRGQQCVMKVGEGPHHGRGPRRYYEPDRELDIHILESTAYRRLKERGICEQGIVPRFFGTMDKFDPKPCQPYLRMFVNDEYPPSAIFLEYIPNLEMLGLNNYTQARMNKLLEGIREIHQALVKHGDPKPRNMLIVKDDPERVVWIDFNRANTYDEHRITDRERALLDEEEEIVDNVKTCLSHCPRLRKPTFQKADLKKRTYSTVHDVSHFSSSHVILSIQRRTGNQSQSDASDNLDDDYVASRS